MQDLPNLGLTLAGNVPDSNLTKSRQPPPHSSSNLFIFLILPKVAYQHHGSIMIAIAYSLEENPSSGPTISRKSNLNHPDR